MPNKQTLERVKQDKREGKSVSTQAGEFVREEMERIREGKDWVRSTKQAIAIGLSNARRAGVALPAPKRGTTSEKTRLQAQHDLKVGQHEADAAPPKRARAPKTATKKEHDSKTAASETSSKQAKATAKKRTPAERSAAARKGAKTKGAAGRSAAAKKAARTRAQQQA